MLLVCSCLHTQKLSIIASPQAPLNNSAIQFFLGLTALHPWARELHGYSSEFFAAPANEQLEDIRCPLCVLVANRVLDDHRANNASKSNNKTENDDPVFSSGLDRLTFALCPVFGAFVMQGQCRANIPHTAACSLRLLLCLPASWAAMSGFWEEKGGYRHMGLHKLAS